MTRRRKRDSAGRVIPVRLSDEELARLDQAASEAGYTRSSALRTAAGFEGHAADGAAIRLRLDQRTLAR